MSDLYFDEGSYYFAENICDNKVFASPFFNILQTKPIHAPAAKLLHIRIGIFDLAMQLLWASARLLVTRVNLRR